MGSRRAGHGWATFTVTVQTSAVEKWEHQIRPGQASNNQYSLTLAPLIAELGVQLGADAQGVPVPCCCSSCPTCSLISHEDEMGPVHPSEVDPYPWCCWTAVQLLLTLHTVSFRAAPYLRGQFGLFTLFTLEIILRGSNSLNQVPR